MYYIFMDGQLLHNPSEDGRIVLDPIAETSMGGAGTCTFKVPVTNPLYDKISKLKSVIRVYRDTENIWSGRVLDEDDDWNRSRSITAEGDLGFFNDSYLPPMSEDYTLPQYLNWIVTQHNAQVDDFKQFAVGNITVDYSKETVEQKARQLTSYTSTKSELDNIVNTYGGYLVARPRGKITTGTSGSQIKHPAESVDSSYITLDYLSEYSSTSKQPIVFGRNMLDLTQHMKGDDIKTVIIPIGKNGLTIEAAAGSGNKDRIEDSAAIAMFGRVIGLIEHADIDDDDELYTAGLADLAEKKKALVSIELKAADLSLLDADMDSFHTGDSVHILSPPHNLDTTLPVKSMRIDLVNPDKSELVIGADLRTLTG